MLTARDRAVGASGLQVRQGSSVLHGRNHRGPPHHPTQTLAPVRANISRLDLEKFRSAPRTG